MIKMKLKAQPFLMVASGQKTVEVRLYDQKRKEIKSGDVIEFTNVDNQKQIIYASVISLHKFDSFEKLFSSELFELTGLKNYTLEQATNAMYEYYTKADEQKYGVLGIRLKLL